MAKFPKNMIKYDDQPNENCLTVQFTTERMMISPETFANLAGAELGEFADKPTTLTEGQKEASTVLWTSANGCTTLGVWECMPGHFTADRTAGGEYCHILSGRATVSNTDGSGARDVGPGDLLVLPRGWTGQWVIHAHMRKLFVIDTSPEA